MSKMRSFFKNVAGPARRQAESNDAGGTGGTAADDAKPDVDQIARDVYDEVQRLLEVNRLRNGDPYS